MRHTRRRRVRHGLAKAVGKECGQEQGTERVELCEQLVGDNWEEIVNKKPAGSFDHHKLEGCLG